MHEAIFAIVVVFFILRQIYRGIAWVFRLLRGSETPQRPNVQPQMGTLPTQAQQPPPRTIEFPQARIPRPYAPTPPMPEARPISVRQDAIPQSIAQQIVASDPYALAKSNLDENQRPSDVQTAAETRQSSKNNQAGFSDFLKDRNSFVRSIILHEILAPPISQRNRSAPSMPPIIDHEL